MEKLQRNLFVFWLFTKIKTKRILAFRFNLIVQSLGMMINNIFYFGMWWLLILKFGDINGYGLIEFLLI